MIPSSKRVKNRRSSVLIIVLAMVVLLTAVVVAFLSRSLIDRNLSSSSFNQTKVDELARSSLDIITGDLKQEIVNGSTNLPSANVSSSVAYPPIYECTNNAYIIPTQNWPGQPTSGAASTLPNLIRISVPTSISTIAFPGVDHPASAIISTTASANGKYVSLARWNQHYLLPTTNTIDSTPTNAFTAPYWAYITTNGPAVITAPSTAVVGRYAYAVYNEGGLLDVNVAGYPSNQTTNEYGAKSASLAYADLSQLTNSSGTSLMTTNQIDQLVGWRNYASAQPTGSFTAYSFAGVPDTNYYSNVALSTNSFMKISGPNGVSGAQWNGSTDQAILSRQQLLSLQKSIPNFPTAALQYLGTFSREVNAPTFYYPPANIASGTSAYPTPDPTNNVNNPNILTLRMTSSGTSPDGFSWNAGDPLVCRRFPLSRLALIAYNATNTGTNTAIYKYFGLYRTTASDPDASKSAWVYTGSSGSITASGSIETLTQVAAETPSREPNFFELLKAAIHQDSLGVWNGNNTSTHSTYVGNSDLADNQADLQILRIGANMIDQADADSYPTVITFTPTSFPSTKGSALTMPAGGIALYAYGVEDLPYINAVGFRCIAGSYLNGSPYTDVGAQNRTLYDQIVPVLWNPHRSINTSSGPVPAKIQLYMTGKTCYVLEGGYYTLTGTSTPSGSLTMTGTNDNLAYGSLSSAVSSSLTALAQTRFNEIALSGTTPSGTSDFTFPAAEQNTGSIIIDQSEYSSFSTPNYIYTTPGGTITAATFSGSYGSLSEGKTLYTKGLASPGGNSSYDILGLTLHQQVIATGRQANANGANDIPSPNSADKGFDGYYSTLTTTATSTGAHHELYLGSGGVGFNVVLRYQDAGGNWQVYNALASNEADPNGNINGNYDIFGIGVGNDPAPGTVAGSTVPGPKVDGIYLSMFGVSYFPAFEQPAALTGTWATPSTTPPSASPNYDASVFGSYGFTDNRSDNTYMIMKADPRSARLGVATIASGSRLNDLIRYPQLIYNTSGLPAPDNLLGAYTSGDTQGCGYNAYTSMPSTGTSYLSIKSTGVSNPSTVYPAMWSQNATNNGAGTFYYDWDQGHTSVAANMTKGAVRPGDDYFTGISGLLGTYATSPTSGVTNTANSKYNIYNAYYVKSSTGSYTLTSQTQGFASKPVVLNRPFRSVGELGYVYRDMPFKSIDFASNQSVDAALLDFFTVDAVQTPIVAGKVDLNTRQPQVLACILNGSFRTDPTGTVSPTGTITVGSQTAQTIAAAIVGATTPGATNLNGPPNAGTAWTGPISNKAQLVPMLANLALTAAPSNNGSTIVAVDTSDSVSPSPLTPPSQNDLYPSIKTQREAPIRALADVGNTRTWNLMIDVIAQTGQYPPGATALSQFVVTGERRYWLHVAIDRYTGKIIDQQLEPVFE